MNINYDLYNSISFAILKETEGSEYYTLMGRIMKLALVRDAGFYEWMILNFSEIMDKEDEALKQIESKCRIIMQFFNSKDPMGIKEGKLLCFGDVFADALKEEFEDRLFYGECLSLGIIANSYISYKRELLSKEEYYEIRDMFVPFGLTISLDPFDSSKLTERIIVALHKALSDNEFVLLKKTGKAAFYNDISEDEIKEAVAQLLVEWD